MDELCNLPGYVCCEADSFDTRLSTLEGLPFHATGMHGYDADSQSVASPSVQSIACIG